MTSSPKLFLVHGRDLRALTALRILLEALGFDAGTWRQSSNVVAPDRRDLAAVAQSGITNAALVIVILTGDEISMLRGEYGDAQEQDTKPRYVPRPNVLLEWGYARARRATRTISVQMGAASLPSDLAGRHVIKLGPKATVRHFVDELVDGIIAALRSSKTSRHHEDFLDGLKDRASAFDAEGSDLKAYLNPDQAPRLIEAGTKIRETRLNYEKFFSHGSLFYLTGHNFGDVLGAENEPDSPLHVAIVDLLTRNPKAKVTLVVAPFNLLALLQPIGFTHLQSSIKRLAALEKALPDEARGRLHITDHQAALSLSAAIRDPDPTPGPDDCGLFVATPRWMSDATGPQRMYFAVDRKTNKDIFDQLMTPFHEIRIQIDAHKRLEVSEVGAALVGEGVALSARTLAMIVDGLRAVPETLEAHRRAKPKRLRKPKAV